MAAAEPEVYLLVLRLLEGSPCTGAFELLKKEAERYGLLGEHVDWRGNRSAASYEEAARARGGLPPAGHLQALLSQLLVLSYTQQAEGVRNDAPPLTLLGCGSRSLVTVQETPVNSEPHGTRTAVARRLGDRSGAGFHGATPPPPSRHWDRQYRSFLPPVYEAASRSKTMVGTHPGRYLTAILASELGVRPQHLRCVHRPIKGLLGSNTRAGAPAVTDMPAAAAGGTSMGPAYQPADEEGNGGRTRAITAFRGHLCAAYCVRFDATGRRILTGADDGNIKVWCVTSGLLQRTLRGHAAEVTDVLVSPNNKHVVSSSLDATVRVWTLSLGVPVAVLLHSSPVNAISFSPTFGDIAAPTGQASDSDATETGAAGDAGVEDAECLRGQPFLITVTADGATRLYDATDWDATPLVLSQSQAQCDAVAPIANASAGTSAGGLPPAEAMSAVVLLAASEGDGAGGGESDTSTPMATCCSVACSGLYACVGTTVAPYLHVWSLLSARRLFESSASERQMRARTADRVTSTMPAVLCPDALTGHRAEITYVAWSPCRHELLSGSRDGTARVWSWEGCPGAPRSLVLAPQASSVAIHAHALATHSGARPPAFWIDGVSWSCDGRLAFTAESLRKQTREEPCLSSCVRCWLVIPSGSDAIAGRASVLAIFAESASPTYVLSPYPHDPQMVVTGSNDGSVCRWNALSGSLCSRFTAPEPAASDENASAVEVFDGAFSPDGTIFAAINGSGVMWLSGMDGGATLGLDGSPYAQFFSSDFHTLVHDAQGNAHDVQFGCEPHRAPRLPICDERGAPHPTEYQRPPSHDPLVVEGYKAAQNALLRSSAALRMAEEDALKSATRREGKGKGGGFTRGEERATGCSELGAARVGVAGSGSQPSPLHWGVARHAGLGRSSGNRSRRSLPAMDVALLSQPYEDDASSGSEWNGSPARHHAGRDRDPDGALALAFSDDGTDSDSQASYVDSDDGAHRRSRSRRASKRSRTALRLALAMEMAGSDDEATVARAAQRAARRARRPERKSHRRRTSTRRYAAETARSLPQNATRRRNLRRITESETEEEDDYLPLSSRQIVVQERAAARAAEAELAEAIAAAKEEAAISRAWLMRGSPERAEYVPQVGDMVVYLRRAHEAALAARPEAATFGESGSGTLDESRVIGSGEESMAASSSVKDEASGIVNGTASAEHTRPIVDNDAVELALDPGAGAFDEYNVSRRDADIPLKDRESLRRLPPFIRHPNLPAVVRCVVRRVDIVLGHPARPLCDGAPVLHVTLGAYFSGAGSSLSDRPSIVKLASSSSTSATVEPQASTELEEWVVVVRGPSSGCPDFILLEEKYAHAQRQWQAATAGMLLRAQFLVECGARGAEYRWYRGIVASVRSTEDARTSSHENERTISPPSTAQKGGGATSIFRNDLDLFEALGVLWENEPDDIDAQWPPDSAYCKWEDTATPTATFKGLSAHEGHVKISSSQEGLAAPGDLSTLRIPQEHAGASSSYVLATAESDMPGQSQTMLRRSVNLSHTTHATEKSSNVSYPHRPITSANDGNVEGVASGNVEGPSQDVTACSGPAPIAPHAAAPRSRVDVVHSCVSDAPDAAMGPDDADVDFYSPWEIELCGFPVFCPQGLPAETATKLRESLEELAKCSAAAPFRHRGPGSARLAAPWENVPSSAALATSSPAPAVGPYTADAASVSSSAGTSHTMTANGHVCLPPIGIELILRRLDRGYYRHAAAVRHDAELCVASACADPESAMLAHAVAPALKAAASGQAWRPFYEAALGGFRRSVVTSANEAEAARREARVAAVAAEDEAEAAAEEREAEARRVHAGKGHAKAQAQQRDGQARTISDSDGELDDSIFARRRSRRRTDETSESCAGATSAGVNPQHSCQGEVGGSSRTSDRERRAAKRREVYVEEEWEEWPEEPGANSTLPSVPSRRLPGGFKIRLRLDHEAGEAILLHRELKMRIQPAGAATSSGTHGFDEEES